MACPEQETETITIAYLYRVEVEIEGISGSREFGPMLTRQSAEQLLLTLSARSNVTKATLVRYEGEV